MRKHYKIFFAVAIFVFFLLYAMTLCLVAQKENHGRIKEIYYGNGNRVYVDTETNVMYFENDISGGMTIMVDENGKPLIWEGD